jgi:hypothetical protein
VPIINLTAGRALRLYLASTLLAVPTMRSDQSHHMRSFQCLRLAFGAFLTFSINHPALSQPLAVNPSAAASDVRNPSSTNPAAAASDVRTPSATNPSAAASQIPQPTAASPSRTNVTPPPEPIEASRGQYRGRNDPTIRGA